MNQFKFLIACLLISSKIGVAQPHYPRDFAGSTYNGPISDSEKPPTPDESSSSSEEDSELPEPAAENPTNVSVSENTKPEVSVEESGVEVLRIGGYIDARDTKHFEESISDLREVASSFDLEIGEVYGIGNYGWLFTRPEIVFTIIGRNGQPRILHTVPKELSINSSPAWLVTTKLGTIILEGVGKLGDLFNLEGKLVLSRLNAATSAPATRSKNTPNVKAASEN